MNIEIIIIYKKILFLILTIIPNSLCANYLCKTKSK